MIGVEIEADPSYMSFLLVAMKLILTLFHKL